MHIRLCQWHADYLKPLVELANNKKIFDCVRDSFPHPYTKEAGEAWLTMQAQRTPSTSFAIEVDGVFAGGIGVEPKTDIHRCSMEIGYWLGEPFWGRGIASKAIELICERVWNDFPDVMRIYAEVFEYNKASMRALEKNGFVLESVRKKAVIKNGAYPDDFVWVKLRS